MTKFTSLKCSFLTYFTANNLCFFNIRNNFNIRTGNPNLLPEFTDSYEVTAIYDLKDLSLNTGVFHRYTTDQIERISTVEDNVNTTTPYNIGTNRSTGLELNAKYTPVKWLTVNGDFKCSLSNEIIVVEVSIYG